MLKQAEKFSSLSVKRGSYELLNINEESTSDWQLWRKARRATLGNKKFWITVLPFYTAF